ncbi:hypothetical protein HYFRA_00000169 [Hymenoscyphus fraxineus]|uniref:Uncharacterized protein n=1 Tax=Hymenoscyphus fraxineus TaxID=746836 RepID=A0A9N9PL28_9HELO|nr:hypothetical protein HYFRA_00000169 [Hymenoscyphus fraxineus]
MTTTSQTSPLFASAFIVGLVSLFSLFTEVVATPTSAHLAQRDVNPDHIASFVIIGVGLAVFFGAIGLMQWKYGDFIQWFFKEFICCCFPKRKRSGKDGSSEISG